VWFSRFADEALFESRVAALERSEPWRRALADSDLQRDPQILRLSPTSRSWLRAEGQARG
jgi:hypothetical protein